MYYKVLGKKNADAETVVLSSGLGGSGGFWQPQLTMLAEHFRVVVYDQHGTGVSQGTVPAGYRMEDMADELAGMLNGLDISRCHLVGHALGGIIGLHLALRYPALLQSLVVINGWTKLDSQTRRCFEVRQNLLLNSGVDAYVQAQPLFLYPGDWLSEHDALLQEERQHQVAHFQGMENLLHRLQALMNSDLTASLGQVITPTLAFSCKDDLLVPWSRSVDLASRLPNGEHTQMLYGGHAMSVTDPETFNPILLDWLLRHSSQASATPSGHLPTETSWPKH
ncbi:MULTISPECIES: pyrimidine utilization protein D [Rahnella]|jgi:aminoacrylate hydrolase|uniref:Putative carbamate hydrolase RutD n=1 Tax=Rahnella sp. (strain Y9602) TaxID=2703885 RepID=A0A0H3FC46_RAHSY|nr:MULTISPECIES: pyrimidine utilization protein D [Rahnella]AYA07836.1 pyrimidine utilization protein D [Rahnella aquatilis]ADW74614.1 pyrimidine utilization protein D [Rahnella aceris]AZP43062.1 pyrimidine utilization protein D [Rahnella aquatilis]AZP47401.1 pyrimidine utilization protein D [Rahnella aquatilis]AZP51845.1 pyrimidine utilization protein D [Rahnella aquatilis]